MRSAQPADAGGEWRINPLYRVEPTRATACALRCSFPSRDYEDEYGACRAYLPERCSSTPPRSGAPSGRRPVPPALDDLIRRARRSSTLPPPLLLTLRCVPLRNLRYDYVDGDVMHNPFVYGEVVPAAAFVNRVVELDRLVGDLAAAQKVFLISPRRYGKSSLIRRALAAMARRGALTVEVTVSSFSSYVAFLEGYARALVGGRNAGGIARAPGCATRSARRAPRCATLRTRR